MHRGVKTMEYKCMDAKYKLAIQMVLQDKIKTLQMDMESVRRGNMTSELGTIDDWVQIFQNQINLMREAERELNNVPVCQ